MMRMQPSRGKEKTRAQPSFSPFFPLPLPPMVPNAWEDLASLLSRAATEMGYKNVAWLLDPQEIAYRVQPYQLCLLQKTSDYRFLEQLLDLDEETLYQLTLHRFSTSLQSPERASKGMPGEIQRPLLTHYLFQSFCHPYSATKICPLCLAKKPVYARLFWSVLPVVGCLEHQIFLVDRCPNCKKPIPVLRTILTKCPHCKDGDYLEAPLVPLPADPLFSQAQGLILERLGVEGAPPVGEPTKQLAPSLLELLPWHYFQLLDAFRYVLGPMFPDAPFLRGAEEFAPLLHQHRGVHSGFSQVEWAVFLTTFHALFLDWPERFFALLEAFPQARARIARKRDQVSVTGVQRDFGVFYEKWLYKRLAHPAFAFLRAAFEQYLREHYTRGEVTSRLQPFRSAADGHGLERPYLNKVQTRALLEIGEDVLQGLIAQGTLQSIEKPIGSSSKRTLVLFEKAEVERLRNEWNELIPLATVAREWLGVTKGVVLMMEQAALLIPTRGPQVDGYKERHYKRAAIEQLKTALLSHAVKEQTPMPEPIPLPRCAALLGSSLVTLLAEILGGRLTPLDTSNGQAILQRLALTQEELSRYRYELERRRHEEQGLLTTSEAAADLGVDVGVLLRWVQLGLLARECLRSEGKQPRLFFKKESIALFRQRFVFVEEAAVILGVTAYTIHKYVRKHRLHPVAGGKLRDGTNRLILLREEIEAFCVTRSQAASKK